MALTLPEASLVAERGERKSETYEALLSAHSQRVGHAIDVVEPRRDQRDLQNPAIVESGGAQAFDIVFPNLGGVASELNHVVQHDPFLRRDWRGAVVILQRFYQAFIKGHSTQKLCVGFDSILAAVGD
jgi:hypothetical protein